MFPEVERLVLAKFDALVPDLVHESHVCSTQSGSHQHILHIQTAI